MGNLQLKEFSEETKSLGAFEPSTAVDSRVAKENIWLYSSLFGSPSQGFQHVNLYTDDAS